MDVILNSDPDIRVNPNGAWKTANSQQKAHDTNWVSGV